MPWWRHSRMQCPREKNVQDDLTGANQQASQPAIDHRGSQADFDGEPAWVAAAPILTPKEVTVQPLLLSDAPVLS